MPDIVVVGAIVVGVTGLVLLAGWFGYSLFANHLDEMAKRMRQEGAGEEEIEKACQLSLRGFAESLTRGSQF